MKQTITERMFVDAFDDANRGSNFSVAGRRALFSFLTDCESNQRGEMALDVIALCCDFSEYQNLEEFQRDYGQDYETLADIERETFVIPVEDESFIIQCF